MEPNGKGPGLEILSFSLPGEEVTEETLEAVFELREPMGAKEGDSKGESGEVNFVLVPSAEGTRNSEEKSAGKPLAPVPRGGLPLFLAPIAANSPEEGAAEPKSEGDGPCLAPVLAGPQETGPKKPGGKRKLRIENRWDYAAAMNCAAGCRGLMLEAVYRLIEGNEEEALDRCRQAIHAVRSEKVAIGQRGSTPGRKRRKKPKCFEFRKLNL